MQFLHLCASTASKALHSFNLGHIAQENYFRSLAIIIKVTGEFPRKAMKCINTS